MSEHPVRARGHALLLRLYPRSLRSEFGGELIYVVTRMRAESRYTGVFGGVRFWLFLVNDLLRTIALERAAALRARTIGGPRSPNTDRPPWFDATIAALVVFALYVATLAPTVAFWDTGEYLTAAHVLGIPHAPGNPLFVLVAHAWEWLLAPLRLPVAVRLNLFSAALSAAAHGCWFLVIERALRSSSTTPALRKLTAAAAVALSATAFTVWNQSNVNEKVYTLSFFTIALVCWLLLRWRDSGCSSRRLVAILFLIVLSSTNHLMGVLVAPAALLFVLMVDRRALVRREVWFALPLVIGVGLLPQFFLPVRAQQHPVLDEGEPSCASVGSAALSIYTWGKAGCAPLAESLRREQYGKPPSTLDPTVYPDAQLPRSPRLLAAQLMNWLQYLDWQWARSIAGANPLFGGARPLLTLLFILLGVLGARSHWRHDRASAAALLALFITLSLGLVLYLNFKYGYAIARDAFPAQDAHEVRERDYFFIIGFSVWGLWCGVGVIAAWRWLTEQLHMHVRRARLVAAPVLALALLPLGLNWNWASRANDYAARDWAYSMLMSIAPYGVLFTNGDNDTFPLWYLQEVEGVRRDVTVMVASYLNTPWYARQVRDLTRPCAPGVSAATDPTRIICQRALQPQQLPAALATRATHINAPDDSILPLSDAEIDRVAAAPFVTQEAVTFRAGAVTATIPAGTAMLPADTFVAAILNATMGKRPVYFAAPHPTLSKLGLYDFTVRRGLALEVENGIPNPQATPGVIPLPRNDLSPVSGAFVDVVLTDTLLRDVFVQHGRLLNPRLPWVDRATTNILLQYAWAHYTVAEAHDSLGHAAEAARHVQQAQSWQKLAEE